MGLSQFPTVSEGVLPLLVMNTVVSVTMLKNMVSYVFQLVGSEREEASMDIESKEEGFVRRRRVSITQFKSMCENRGEEEGGEECCVCLCGFKEEEEVSELVSCKHFFHRGCLDKWFGNNHTTCPLCRSVL